LEKYDKQTFGVLLSIFPIIVVTNMIYPFPEGKHKTITSLMKGFGLLDIIDMAELIFGDVGCFQIDTSSWLVFFYVALVLSAILTTSSYGLEQQKDNNKHC